MRTPAAVLEPDAEGTKALRREQPLGFGPRNALGLGEPALGKVPEALAAPASDDCNDTPTLEQLEHQRHLAASPPGVRVSGHHQVGFDLAREQRSALFELAQQVPLEARIPPQELGSLLLVLLLAPPAAHARADEREVLDRPDEGAPLDELALFPEQSIQFGRVVGAAAAPQDESLRGCDRGDRIDLEEAEPTNRFEHAVGAAVEELCSNRDPACLCEADGRGLHRVCTLSATRAAATGARGRLWSRGWRRSGACS